MNITYWMKKLFSPPPHTFSFYASFLLCHIHHEIFRTSVKGRAGMRHLKSSLPRRGPPKNSQSDPHHENIHASLDFRDYRFNIPVPHFDMALFKKSRLDSNLTPPNLESHALLLAQPSSFTLLDPCTGRLTSCLEPI